MKRNRYTEEQTAFALRQAESGTPVPEIVARSISTIWGTTTHHLLTNRGNGAFMSRILYRQTICRTA